MRDELFAGVRLDALNSPAGAGAGAGAAAGGTAGAQAQARGAMAEASRAKDLLAERGGQLNQLQQRALRMREEAEGFQSAATKLRQQQERSWW